MTQENEYDFKPPEKPETPPPAPYDLTAPLKPGDPGWVPPEVVIEKAEPAEEEEAPPDPDIEKHKGVAALAYILFLIPLIAAPNSKFARFHANQGLLAFILLVIVTITVAVLYFLSVLSDKLLADIGVLKWFFGCGLTLLQPALLVAWVALVVYGITHAANGESKPLPVIGHWTLIK